MKLAPQDVQMLFLGTAGIGLDFGQIAPQLRSFDVFYDSTPVVGLQVVGNPPDPPNVLGFNVGGP